jgi:hypothetical protein
MFRVTRQFRSKSAGSVSGNVDLESANSLKGTLATQAMRLLSPFERAKEAIAIAFRSDELSKDLLDIVARTTFNFMEDFYTYRDKHPGVVDYDFGEALREAEVRGSGIETANSVTHTYGSVWIMDEKDTITEITRFGKNQGQER